MRVLGRRRPQSARRSGAGPSTRSPSTSSSSSTGVGCRKISAARRPGRASAAGDLVEHLARPAAPTRSCSPSAGPAPGRSSSTTPPRVRADGLTTTGAGRRPAVGRSDPAARSARPSAIWRGLGVAVEDGVDHLVGRAGADRVVGGVADDLEPGHVEQAAGPARRRAGTGRTAARPAARARARPRPAACLTSTRLEATPMSRLARAPERSSPVHVGQAVGAGRPRTCSASERDAQLVRRRARWPRPRPGPARAGASGGRCRSSRGRAPASRSPCSCSELADAADERLGVVGDAGAVAVALGQVLGPDGGAVGRLPPERRCGRWPTARPATRRRARSRTGGGAGASGRRGRTCRAGSRRPWRRRSAAARRRPSCRLRTSVSPDTRNSSGRAYHGPIAIRPVVASAAQRRPRPRGAPRGSRRPPPSARRAGSGRKDGSASSAGEELVEQVDQLQAERLERRVPLPVPVGVGDDRHGASHALRVRPWPNPAPDGSRLVRARRSRNPASDRSLSHKPST